MRQLSHVYLVLLLIFGLTGCSTLGYYQQAASGQLSLLWHRQPIDELLDNPQTPSALRHKLTLALQARRFARQTLDLPVGDTFSDYVALDQPYVVYNLMVAPEFSLEPTTWCYPFIGCQSYRGYFNLDDARAAREPYAEAGNDTFIGGVTAYSSLGWFDDPIHSGFTNLPDDRMVELMFHELAHKQIYIADDTRFNESFATAVELEGLKRWLTTTGQPEKYQETRARLARRSATLALIEATAGRLDTLYGRQDALDVAELRREKAAILTDLRDHYRALEGDWTEAGPLSGVMTDVNNAVLGLFRQYNTDVPGFRQMLADNSGDFAAFYQAVDQLAEAPAEVRRQRLALLGQAFHEDF